MIIKAIHKRAGCGPTTREINEAAGKIPSKVIERIADAAILHTVMPPHYRQSTVSDTMNTGRLIGSTPASSVEINAKFLHAARQQLEERIIRARDQHEQTIGTEKEGHSAIVTNSAIATLRNAINQIDQELSLFESE